MSVLSNNLSAIVSNYTLRGGKIEDLCSESKVTKKTLYDIMHDRIVPRRNTLKKLEQFFELNEGDLEKNYECFDIDFLIQRLIREFDKYNEEVSVGEICDMLIKDCGMSCECIFGTEIPDDATQQRVIEYLRSKRKIYLYRKELFKTISNGPFMNKATKVTNIALEKRINVLTEAVTEFEEMRYMFLRLDANYQKVICNMTRDLFILNQRNNMKD